MEKKINLIPSEMTVPTGTIKATKLLIKMLTAGSIILLVVIVGIISVFVYLKLELTKTTASVEDLKTKITSLEQSEQKLILTKDRLAKISVIKSYPSIEADLSNFSEVTDLFVDNSDSSLVAVGIQPAKTEISVVSRSSSSLSAFLEPLSKLSKFKSVILLSLGFSPSSGFISDLVLAK